MLVNPSSHAKFKTQRIDFHEAYSDDVIYMIDIIYLYDYKMCLHIYCSNGCYITIFLNLVIYDLVHSSAKKKSLPS